MIRFSGDHARGIKGRRRGQSLEHLAKPVQWLRRQVRSVGKLAGVSVLGSHGLRGTDGGLAIEAGETAKAVPAALGHTNTAITCGH
jgi:hypothetical protein